MIDIVSDNWLLFLVGQYPNGPLGGLVATFLIAVVGLALAFPCAMALALGRISPYRSIHTIAGAVVHSLRGTPFLMVIFWSYYALPMLLGGPISGFWTLVGALVLYESAYLAEVIRSGIEALPKGQGEAAKSLGLNYWKSMILIVLPQALYNSLPSLLSQFVSLIKETSLGYVIGVNEFTFAASQVNSTLLTRPVEVFSTLAITYFILCFSLTQTARMLERRIAQRRQGSLDRKKVAVRALTPFTTEPAP
ncbi:amino acid ABC transporter permease [Rhizobium rhizogenes]|uniref:amino acid ABC transporter permease n=1 Tax=Rhizobium rhizogenes TaxID=359 RepID=UPI001574C11D|nr:amino acid ABC transporter permease [Rhizobium rhizogenes]NTH22911.1 amino acid ABC transporter permease [Rhizobium rhizogenes]NTH35940.1 amino acid ABC transporter permease [Rhizobium rhizogenes]